MTVGEAAALCRALSHGFDLSSARAALGAAGWGPDMISLGQDQDKGALRRLGATTGCSAHMEQPGQGVEG